MNATEFISKTNTIISKLPVGHSCHGILKEKVQPQNRFSCPVCRSTYNTVEEMLACLSQPVIRGRFKVGDIVMTSEWRGNRHDDNDPWIACIRPANSSSKDHFEHVTQTYPWYVITSIWDKDHREVCSLVTLLDGYTDYGWNPTVEETHCCMWKAGEPFVGHGKSDYWSKHLDGVEIRMPSDKLKSEAALLAAEGYVTDNLL